MVTTAFSIMVWSLVAQEDQAWYLLEGSARTAAAEAKAVMESAMQATGLGPFDGPRMPLVNVYITMELLLNIIIFHR